MMIRKGWGTPRPLTSTRRRGGTPRLSCTDHSSLTQWMEVKSNATSWNKSSISVVIKRQLSILVIIIKVVQGSSFLSRLPRLNQVKQEEKDPHGMPKKFQRATTCGWTTKGTRCKLATIKNSLGAVEIDQGHEQKYRRHADRNTMQWPGQIQTR